MAQPTTTNTVPDFTQWLRADDRAGITCPDSNEAWCAWTNQVVAAGFAGILLERSAQLGIAIPPQHAARLRNASMAIAANNLHLFNEVEPILDAFHRENVPVMLLKGAALASIYGRPDLRPMGDVDLLVRPGDIAAAFRILDEQGCRHGIELVSDDFFPRYYYEIELFTRSSRLVRIDLHVRPFRPLRISQTMPDDALWEGAERVSLGESKAYVPCAELMFIHLAVHAAFHGFSRLLWLYDIKRFVEQHGAAMNWPLVIQRAVDWHLAWPLLRAIEQTRDMLGLAVPAEVCNALRGQRITWADRLTLTQAPRDAASPIEHVLVNLLCTPGIRFRLGYLAALLGSSRTHLASLYPYRHPGWTVIAQGCRVARAIGRMTLAACRPVTHAISRKANPVNPV